MKYSVRGLCAAEARPEVIDLWQRLGASESDARSRFDWAFDPGPERSRCFLLDASGAPGSGSTVVGMVGIYARDVVVEGTRRRAALLGGFQVEKNHRTFFPALTLQRATFGWARREFDLVYGFPNPSASPIMKKLGFGPFAHLERHVLVLHHLRYVEQVWAGRGLAKLIAAPLDAYRLLVQPGLVRGAPRGRAWRRFDSVDARFARLFDARALPENSAGSRDGAFLQRRFLERPDERTTVYGLCARDSGELDAWVVVHVGGDVAHVRDLQGRDVKAMCSALRLVANEVRKQGCASLSFLCAAPPALVAGLWSLGFQARPSARVMIGLPGDRLADGPPSSLQRWYLTEADEDQ